MKLSARTRYAARLLLDLAQHATDAPRTASALSEQTGVSVQFIEQIIKPLKKAGLINSVRGASGGHMLSRSPEEISLADVVVVMEGGIRLTDCCIDNELCTRTPHCKTRVAWMKISDLLERELKSITLADLMSGESLFDICGIEETLNTPLEELPEEEEMEDCGVCGGGI
ncbi:RrF2 family transcriptional regulator [Oleidesulfovibrio sp.]|uniref:RrF2 family transcriptional regulator n=1 Tax=Oleidesulfovibrio sp. TaxID=2909707 RepID=UPI003A84D741